MLAALGGCSPDYSPNTYSPAAVQQANKVDQGVIAGFREVAIKSDGTVGAVTGGAAGGVLGAQAPGGGINTALTAIGGTFIGGLVGTTVEHTTGDITAFEYLVRKPNGDLVSVTQKDVTPLAVGLKVLVIEGKQARVVPDYSVPENARAPAVTGKTENKTETKNGGSSAKSNTTDKANETDQATKGVTATDTAGDTRAAPAQPPQPAAVDTLAIPASGEVDSAPASPSQGSAPQPAATPAPQMTPAQAADPQPAEADQHGSTPLAEPTQAAPAFSEGEPTP